ncbi:MAG TPA: hypothetical protein VJY15_03170 [Candidatus Acidoferrum sp.]|nr:hypothetical protein [Candidatus Acidoferrum sp.]
MREIFDTWKAALAVIAAALGIIGTVVGGIFWLQHNFPDRAYVDGKFLDVAQKLNTLNCLLNTNIESAQGELSVQLYTDEIERDQQRLTAIQDKPVESLSRIEKEREGDLSRRLEIEKDALSQARASSEKTKHTYERNKCNDTI